MLKVTVTPSDYERTIEPVAKSLARVAEAGSSCGLVRIYSYPSAESLMAAGLLGVYLHSLGVYPAFHPTIKQPARLECPSILLGFNQLSLKGSQVESEVLAVSSGSLAGSPPPGAVYVESDGSIVALSALAVAATGYRFDANLASIVVAGLYAGRYVTPYGKFSGLDRVVVDKFINDYDGFYFVTTLKVYRPGSGTVCEAVARTLNPYYPGLTGNLDECRRLVEARVGDAALKQPSNLGKDDLTKILDAIMDVVESNVEGVDAANYIAGLVVSEYYPSDPREALDAIVNVVEAQGNFAYILTIISNIDVEYSISESYLENLAPRLRDIYSYKPRKVRGPGWLRIYALPRDLKLTPTLAWRIFSTLGAIEDDSIVALEDDGKLLVSPIQAEYALGDGGARRLVETKAAKEHAGTAWLVLEVARQ